MLVTRFAPSPTGYLHVGGARTALFCWLTARRSGGKMILRIEDTDQKRNTPSATQQVIDDLRWLGIDWDEGPDVGGPHGPYLQSQRRDIYDQYLKQLLEAGKAYYCFDTPEELQAMREEAQKRKKTFLYPRPTTFPNAKDVEKARTAGRPAVVRFAMGDKDITVSDIIRGEVKFAISEISDFIICKSDGFPTYHFACDVDDELMQVTHIIRGQEHLMNTPGHLALQQALGFRTPTYAHMSVTVSQGGGKLSKRERAKTLLKAIKNNPDTDLDALSATGSISRSDLDAFIAGKQSPDAPKITAMADYLNVHLPEINVVDFFHNGYIPEAMVNFIALLGWNPGDDREIMALDDLIAAFDITRLSKSNSLFDRKKLIAFNTEHMRMIKPEKLLRHFRNYLCAKDSPISKADDARLAHILKACENARTLEEIASKSEFLFTDKIEFDPKAVKKVLKKEGVLELLLQIKNTLSSLDAWDETSLHQGIEGICTENQVGMGKVAQPIRVAVTGTTISPGITDTLILLGKDRTIRRIDETLKHLKKSP